MKKKFKNITGWNIIWLLIYLMPFLISLGYTFIFAYGIKGNVSTFTDINPYLSNIYLSSLINFFGSSRGFIANAMRVLVYKFVDVSNSLYGDLLILVIQYIVIVSIIRIAVDVILMLPNIVHNFIDKIGGERE